MALVRVSSISWPTHSWAVWLGCRGPLLHRSNTNGWEPSSSVAAAANVTEDAAVSIATSCNMFVRWRISSDGADRERLIAVVKLAAALVATGVQVSGPVIRMRLLINFAPRTCTCHLSPAAAASAMRKFEPSQMVRETRTGGKSSREKYLAISYIYIIFILGVHVILFLK